MTTTRPGFSTRHFGLAPDSFHSSMVTGSASGAMALKLSAGEVRSWPRMWMPLTLPGLPSGNDGRQRGS